jgi:hypothetical protein
MPAGVARHEDENLFPLRRGMARQRQEDVSFSMPCLPRRPKTGATPFFKGDFQRSSW